MNAGYGNIRFEHRDLIPVLPAQSGACDVCHQGCVGKRCASCRTGVHDMTASGTPAVLPIALRVKSNGLWRATWAYKNDPSAAERDLAARQLAWLVAHFMPRHEACLAHRVGVRGFDAIVPIPSSSGTRTGTHPLVALLQELPWAADRLADWLGFSGNGGQSHTLNRDRFQFIGPPVRQPSVLLFDDTFTRGANTFSAIEALSSTGARVAVAVIARHFDPHWSSETTRYYETARRIPFDFDACALCDRRPQAEIRMTPSAAPGQRASETPDPWGTQGGHDSPF